MCNCKSCHSKQLLKNDYIRILKSLLLNNNWSPKGLLLFQILVSFSLLKVTFDGLLDTFPPCIMDYHGLSWTIMDYLLLQAGPKIGFDIGNGREITGFLSIFNDQDHVEDC